MNIALDPIAMFGVPLASSIVQPDQLIQLAQIAKEQAIAEGGEALELARLKHAWQLQMQSTQRRNFPTMRMGRSMSMFG